MLVRGLGWIAAAVLTGIIIFAAGWTISGGRLYRVQTGSMQPGIRPGDAVLTRPLTFEQLRVGDVVVFRDSAAASLRTTHRVTAVDYARATFTTQGDNNPTADLPHNARLLEARATYVAPHLGSYLDWVVTLPGLMLGVYLPLCALAAYELRRLARPHITYSAR